VAGSLRAEEQGLLRRLGFFGGFFGEFLECMEWLGPNHKYFSESKGSPAILPTRRDHDTIYKKLRGLNANGKKLRIFQIYFPTGKCGGPGPQLLD
jgi:hypothetical protein